MNEITIEANIPEDIFMESMLNEHFSGRDVMILLGFYALANRWHINKLIYYNKLMEKKK